MSIKSLTTESQLTTALLQGLASLQQLFGKTAQYGSLEAWQSAPPKLLQYIHFLHKWNQAYNLTAVRDPLEMVTKHILDSLSIAPYISGQQIIDVGTGAGLPGIPLALIYPEKKFVLLDSNEKKTRFLHQCVQELSLSNVSIVHSRVEAYVANPCFDQVLTRAFATLKEIWLNTHHLCCQQGSVLAMKGIYSQQEIAELVDVKIEVIQITVPGLKAERHLLIVKKN